MRTAVIVFVLAVLASGSGWRLKRAAGDGYNNYNGYMNTQTSFVAPGPGGQNKIYTVKIPVTYTFMLRQALSQQPNTFSSFLPNANNYRFPPGYNPQYTGYSPQYSSPQQSPSSNSYGRAWATVASQIPLSNQVPVSYASDAFDLGAYNRRWGANTRSLGSYSPRQRNTYY